MALYTRYYNFTNIHTVIHIRIDYNYYLYELQDYQPWRGDKVKIELLDNGTTKTVQSVKPFSIQKYTGMTVYCKNNVLLIFSYAKSIQFSCI